MSLLPDQQLLDGAPRTRADWARLLAPALLAYAMLLVFGAVRGLAVISTDDLMRFSLAYDLFNPLRPIVEENWRDDLYYWPWGHLAFLRLALETIGEVMPDYLGGVLAHAVLGFVLIGAMGWATGLLGGRSRAVVTATFLLATSPWALKLGLSMLSDLPGALVVLCGTYLLAFAIRDPGAPNFRRRLLAGDVFFAVGTSLRYEIWVMACVAGVASTVALHRRGLRGRAAVRLALDRFGVLSIFPVFWLLIQAARFEGNILYFREIPATRALERFSHAQEAWLTLQYLFLTSPAAVILAVVALLGLLQSGRGPALAARLRAMLWFPVLLTATSLVFLVFSNEAYGHPSNIPGRLTFTAMVLLLPMIGLACERGWPTLGGETFARLWGVGLVCASLFGLGALARTTPYLDDKPVRFVAYLKDRARQSPDPKAEHLSLVASYGLWEHHMIAVPRLREYDLGYVPYDDRFAWRSGMADLTPNTRYVLTTNRFYVNGLWRRFPTAPIYQEGPYWFLVDLSGRGGDALEERLLSDPRIHIERARGTGAAFPLARAIDRPTSPTAAQEEGGAPASQPTAPPVAGGS